VKHNVLLSFLVHLLL